MNETFDWLFDFYVVTLIYGSPINEVVIRS